MHVHVGRAQHSRIQQAKLMQFGYFGLVNVFVLDDQATMALVWTSVVRFINSLSESYMLKLSSSPLSDQ
jgi:hypothetical protein